MLEECSSGKSQNSRRYGASDTATEHEPLRLIQTINSSSHLQNPYL